MQTETLVASSETTEAPSAPKAARKPRGFAVMDPVLVRELARRGGKAVHELGRAHRFTSKQARAAGTKGGLACQRAARLLRAASSDAS